VVARQADDAEAFIGGGGEIFAQALALADRIYLTTVHTRAGCDVFFPTFDPAVWVEQERTDHGVDGENEHPSRFQCFQKMKSY